MPASTRIPATIVTGFLGSGKTTLLRHILENADGRRIAIIVNEFGERGIDGELLRNCAIGCEGEEGAGEVMELANGCLCCTVQEEFYPAMQALIERRDEIDAILIETSGLALPKPLVQAFNWPDIRNACTVNAVVTVVDVPATAAGQFAADPKAVDAQRREDPNLDHESPLHDLFEDQLSAADLVVLSKCDLVNEAGLQNVETQLRAELPDAVKLLRTEQGRIDPELVLGVGANTQDTIHLRKTHHEHHHHGDDDHDHDNHHHDHDHAEFDSLVISLPPVALDRLEATLQTLVDTHTIYRIKGFVAVAGKPMRRVVHGVGRRLDGYYDQPWSADEIPEGQLVFIGHELDGDALRAALANVATAEAVA